MSIATPYPSELLRVARKVVWYEKPEEALADLMTFLTHLMVYGSSADVSVAERYVPTEEFRRVLEHAPAGVFTREAWEKWHERFGIQCHLCHGASFQMVRLARRPGVSLVGSRGRK